MTTKYQQHYNKVLTGTLTDTIMKSISYQANIQLANEIIAEQEKTITELQGNNETVSKELEQLKNLKSSSENVRISTLENNVKTQVETITRLNSELSIANKIKVEYEALKLQVNNMETFRNQLIKEREAHQKTKDVYDSQIDDLKQKIEVLENPPKKKKVKSVPMSLPVTEILVEKEEQLEAVTEDAVRDGGSF